MQISQAFYFHFHYGHKCITLDWLTKSCYSPFTAYPVTISHQSPR
jgi:hypothetical protein